MPLGEKHRPVTKQIAGHLGVSGVLGNTEIEVSKISAVTSLITYLVVTGR